MSSIYIAADPLGDALRRGVVEHLQQNKQFTVVDLGVFDKYYEAAHKAAGLVQQSRAAGGKDRAVLLCGTGQGMSIIANKYPDVYAACVENAAGAANAAAINHANVLTLGAKLLKDAEAAAILDAWLQTPFTAGYPEFKDFLEASLSEIPAMFKANGGKTAAGAAMPSYAVITDGQPGSSWKVIPGMGHDSCLMCTLMGQLANEPGAAGPFRALARFPAGCREPPHTHSHSQELLVLSGDKTFTNHSTGSITRLGPWGYSYTPAGQVHSAQYHADTVFYIGFEGPMDIFWQDPTQQGIQWTSELAKAAAEQQPWQPTDTMRNDLEQLPQGAVALQQ
ncbi:hypothetical protein OEZ85_004974 [Tetradesmus obliquus]|uniref:Cupin 2 conserved barrel domain-containing protein n=1 Tax=Tetradesmus obliquus TaxID=3088 RepID=A0ABY8UGF0_TETOB|nr:hypothetical protein OEZ85_004974 [Tetradesmus obliquus]